MSIFSKWFSVKKQQNNYDSTESVETTRKNVSRPFLDYCEEGQKQLVAGNYVLAIEYFQAAIETNRHNDKAYIGLSEAYLAQDKIVDAEKTVYQLLATNPESKKAQEQLTKIKELRNESETAVVAQPQKKYTEEELREKIQASIKVNIVKGQEGQHEGFIPFDPKYELRDYEFPSLDLLEEDKKDDLFDEAVVDNKSKLVETLVDAGVAIDKIKATVGPMATLYEIKPAPGVVIARIRGLDGEIARRFSVDSVNIIAPIPGKDTIGIELPNNRDETVKIRSVLSSADFQLSNDALPCAIGKTNSNEACVIDLAKMPNVLIAGASGTGKSTLCHAMIFSLLYKLHPSELKLVLIDLKGLEFNYYDVIERHFLAKLPDLNDSIVTDDDKAVRTLESLCLELDERVNLLKDAGCRNVMEYNEKFKDRKLLPTLGHRFLPYLVLVIDDYSLLISSKGKEASQALLKLLGMGKAVGIHAIVGTSRVSADVFSTQMKSCIPARIAFRVNSASESRSLLDVVGANMLGEYGEMMALIPGNSVIKVKGANVSSKEIKSITEFIGLQRGYGESFLLPRVPNGSDSGYYDIEDDGERDSLFEEAARIVVQTQQGSTAMIQRKLKLGYNRAGRIIDQLEAAGIVGPFSGSKSREVKVYSEAVLEQILRDLYNKDNGI